MAALGSAHELPRAAPHAALEPWLECIWERRGEPGAPVRVLPDGCIDIVWTEGAGTQVVGPNTTAFVVPVDGRPAIVGARMLPGGAPALLGIAAEALRDVRGCRSTRCWRDGGRGSSEALDEARRSARRAARRAARARRIAAPRPDPLVRTAVARLERPGVAIAELAARPRRQRAPAAAPRHDRGRLRPRRLARVLRLRRALRAARAGDELARVAFDAGYADQAHFAHDCRELAGVAPSVLLAA